jgi:hypothetical protein
VNSIVQAHVEVSLRRRASINIASQEASPVTVHSDNSDTVMMKLSAKDSHAAGTVYVTLSRHNARLLAEKLAASLGLLVVENAATIAKELKP